MDTVQYNLSVQTSYFNDDMYHFNVDFVVVRKAYLKPLNKSISSQHLTEQASERFVARQTIVFKHINIPVI